MIGLIVTLLVAALAYLLLVAITGSAIVGIVAAILILLAGIRRHRRPLPRSRGRARGLARRHRLGWLRARRTLGRPSRPTLTQATHSSLRA